MNRLEVGDMVQRCTNKLEFIEHFFAFVPMQETDIPQRVTQGPCFILRDIIEDLEHAAENEGHEKEVSEEGKEVV